MALEKRQASAGPHQTAESLIHTGVCRVYQLLSGLKEKMKEVYKMCIASCLQKRHDKLLFAKTQNKTQDLQLCFSCVISAVDSELLE